MAAILSREKWALILKFLGNSDPWKFNRIFAFPLANGYHQYILAEGPKTTSYEILRLQVTATHLKMSTRFAGARSWNELQWLDLKKGHLDNKYSQ